MELLDHCRTGPGPLEGFAEQTHRRLHFGVRIKDDTILRVVHIADGHHLLELPRRARLRMPPRSRALSTCSSASLIVPFFRPR